jgi:hypothetical protein
LQVVFRNWIESEHDVIDADGGYRSWWILWLSLFRSRSAPLWRVELFTGHPIDSDVRVQPVNQMILWRLSKVE